jgi:signal recognition particle GTPase
MAPPDSHASDASMGILIVGLGGNNGVTTVAGILANQMVRRRKPPQLTRSKV